ncbi:MAG TPA: helix-turn-helix transcriptional regulator [Rubricoccaceae bacterium]|jgi:AraC-like DNA-binding protein
MSALALMSGRASALLVRAVALVDARLHEPDFRVDAVAEALHLSPRHFRRLIAATTGRTPRDLLRQRRMVRARDLLDGDALRVEDVARAVGYANVSAFGRAFRAVTGVAPRADARALPDIVVP